MLILLALNRHEDWVLKLLLWPFSKPRLLLWIQLSLAWPRAYALRVSDKRTDPEAESKAEAVVSKRACDKMLLFSLVPCQHCHDFVLMQRMGIRPNN